MSSDERQEHILIEGDCCVELDYGQMSLAILYGLTGTKPPDGDLYDLSAEGIPTDYRKGIKTVSWPPKTVPVFVDQWSGKEWHSFRGPRHSAGISDEQKREIVEGVRVPER